MGLWNININIIWPGEPDNQGVHPLGTAAKAGVSDLCASSFLEYQTTWSKAGRERVKMVPASLLSLGSITVSPVDGY